MTQHSEGPWRLNGQRIEYGPIVAGDGFCVAIVSRDPVESEANARLLVAAPDLLAACKETLGRLRRFVGDFPRQPGDLIDLLEAALAKAGAH